MIGASAMKDVGEDALLRQPFPRSLADKRKGRWSWDNRYCETFLLEQAEQEYGFICSNAR